jgi:hypothetical protein
VRLDFPVSTIQDPQEREVGGAPPFNFLDSTGAATIDDIEDGEPVLAANEKVF